MEANGYSMEEFKVNIVKYIEDQKQIFDVSDNDNVARMFGKGKMSLQLYQENNIS